MTQERGRDVRFLNQRGFSIVTVIPKICSVCFKFTVMTCRQIFDWKPRGNIHPKKDDDNDDNDDAIQPQ